MQDVLQILDGRSKRMDGFSYKLSTAGNYGIATAFDTPDIDESRMAVRFPFASGQRRDGVGDLLEIGGIRLDRHRQNPVCLYDHGKSVSLPCAKALDPESGLYTVDLDLETQTAWVKAFFYNGKGIDGVEKSKEYDHALFCEQLFDLIAKGFVRAGSIGYQVIKGLHLPPDPSTGTPQGLHLISVLMLEASAVVMPANQDTVMKALALSSVCGKPMSPVLFKSLSSYAPEHKAQMGYEGKAIHWTPGKEDTKPEGCTCKNYPQVKMRNGSGHEFECPYHKSWEEQGGFNRNKKSTETVPVPLEKLPDTQIPPAKWKPGAGAIKELQEDEDKGIRTEHAILDDYDGALQDSIRAGVRIKPASPPYNAIVEGDERRVNDFLNKWHAKSCKSVPGWIRPGVDAWDALDNRVLRILSITPDGMIQLGTRDNYFPLPDLRHPAHLTQVDQWGRKKSIEESKPEKTQEYHKALKAVRMKYRVKRNPEFQIYIDGRPVGPIHSSTESARRWLDNVSRTKITWVSDIEGRSADTVARIGDPSKQNPFIKSSKSLDLRKKYRSVKKLRHKLKSGQPGAAIVHIGEKDMAAAKQMATSRGIKFAHLGTGDTGLARVKLIGADDGIDEVAKHYGKRVKSMSDKALADYESHPQFEQYHRQLLNSIRSRPKGAAIQELRRLFSDSQLVDSAVSYMLRLGEVEDVDDGKGGTLYQAKKNLQGNKSMSDKKTKIMKNGKKKAMDDTPADVPDDAGSDSSSEKWGAQMMRRAHEDHGILMKDYDEMMGVLEDDDIHKHFSDHMGNMSKFMDDTEKLWGKKYDNEDHDYEPLNKDLTEDEAEEVADELVDETEDTEDDGDVEDKDADTIDDNAVPSGGEEEEEVSPDEVVEGMSKAFLIKEVKRLRNKYGKKFLKGGKKKSAPCPDCGKPDCDCGTKDLTGDELEGVEQDLDTQVEDTEADPKSLQPHEHAAVGDAAGFLREKSVPESQFDEEDRYKSYHYHKTLDGIGQVEDMAAEDGIKSDPTMPDDGSTGLDPNIDGNEQMHPHRKACKDASSFFKQLAMSKDFGDPHRQAAGKYAEILEGVVGKKDENTMNPDDGTHQIPGGVAGKEFEEKVRQNGERIKALMMALGTVR